MESGTKKYKISKFYIGVYLAGLILLSPLYYFCYRWVKELISTGTIDFYFIFALAITLIGTVACLYQILFDFHFGKFSVDTSGIFMYIGFKTHFLSWDAIQDCGILGICVESTGGAEVADTYWVYFSTDYLSPLEQQRFLRKTRRDLKRVAYFQYNKETLHAVLPSIPEKFATVLRRREEQIVEEMNLLEKLYNK